MKRICIFFGIFIMSIASMAETVSLNQSMTSDNPNRNPNWNWRSNAPVTLYVNNQTFDVLLPYYSNCGQAAADLNISGDRDIFKSAGWELVLRDFGWPEEDMSTPMPFFILYNKYRGIFRVFFWSTMDQTFTHGIGKFEFQTKTYAKTAASLTINEKEDGYLDSYDPDKCQTCITSIGYQQWSYLDFNLVGYDPNIVNKEDPTFVITIAGVDQTNVVLSGNVELLAEGVVSMNKQSEGGFNNVINGITTSYTDISKRWKDLETARASYETMANNNSNTWWGGFIQTLGTIGNQAWIPALGPAAGFLKLILGGGSSNNSERIPTPMTIEGDLTINGELVTNQFLFSLILRAPGSIHINPTIDEESNILPLYDDPLGVFNLVTKPVYDLFYGGTGISPDPEDWVIEYSSVMETPVQVVYNTGVFQSIDITAAHVTQNELTNSYMSLAGINNIPYNQFYSADGGDDLDHAMQARLNRKIAIKATIVPYPYSEAIIGDKPPIDGGPILITVVPITIIKTYEPDYDMFPNYDADVFKSSSIQGDGINPEIGYILNPYPNPFTEKVNIEIDLQGNDLVRINVYNLQGQIVESLVDEFLMEGKYVYYWSPINAYPGIYLIKYNIGDKTYFEKINCLNSK